MWRRSFIATTVMLGGTVDEALVAIGARPEELGATLADLVARLRAPHRVTRAAAVGNVVSEIAQSIEKTGLRGPIE